MVDKYIFPYSEIDKDSKIAIYGAGVVGQQLLSQLMQSKYCDCLFVVDKNYKKIQTLSGIEVCAPERLKNNEYDKVVIASTLYIDEIYDLLLGLNIDKEKIVSQIQLIVDNDAVYIRDYSNYKPKHRDSLRNSKIGKAIERWYTTNKEETVDLVRKFLSFKENYDQIPMNESSNGGPCWNNGFIPPFDAISIYGFLALKNPRYYVEVGSGNTTMFAAQSIIDNKLRTKIISIDPYPRAEIDKICYKIYRMPFEDMDLDYFAELTAEDVFLLDNSHRSFPNSDVTVFFTEVLPRLHSGVLYTMHDIFLPYDYPEIWSKTQKRWYNEQYLFCAYLLGGADGDKIICPNCFLGSKDEIIKVSENLFGQGRIFKDRDLGGGFFWMEKA